MYKMFSASLSKTKIRYEVNFQNGIECGGAYVKLLSKTPELNLVSNAATLSVTLECIVFKVWSMEETMLKVLRIEKKLF